MEQENEEKKKYEKLPSCIIPFANNDKKSWHERWKAGDDLLQFPHPFRATLTGPPNSGKSTTVMNILIRAEPKWDRIIIVYPGGQQGTTEYDSLGSGVEYMIQIPAPDMFPTPSKQTAADRKKTLVVIDDFELKELSKNNRKNLDRLIGHVSTHRNVSVILCAQEYFNVPSIARRCSNVHVFWRPRDHNNLAMMSSRVGEDLESLFQFCNTSKCSIWVDQTSGSPAPLRLNGYIRINKE